MSKIELHSALKQYYTDSHRVMPPSETLERIRPVIPEIGITRVADISGLDRIGLPVFSAIRPSAASGAISVYAGKGTTATEARVSVIMEAAERFSAEVEHSRQRLVYGSREELSADRMVLNPTDLILPGPLAPAGKIEWYPGWDLIEGQDILVPANAVFHPYTPQNGKRQLFRSNTNGLAAGNVIEEAIFHGLMEVIERDAVSIAEATRNPGLELRPGQGPVADIMYQFESNDVRVKLWWLPTDTGIPTVVAVSDDERLRDAALLLMGAGSHTDPQIAALRALTEVAQSRATQIHGAREDTDRESIARRIGYDRMKRLNKHWFIESASSVDLEETTNLSTRSLGDDIKLTLERLKNVVTRVVVADITTDALTLPAVRIIVPSFEVYFLDKERQGNRIKTWRHKTA